jgi:peptidoglycan-N-acetylglucosamine deacetylase
MTPWLHQAGFALDQLAFVGANAALSTGTVSTGQAVAIGVGGAMVGAGATAVGFGIFHPRVSLFGPVIWSGPRDRNAVALTFDDGPHPKFSSAVSEILAKRSSRATFFCVGQFVEQHPALTRELRAAGHELGNHTWSHGMGTDIMFAARLVQDLKRCQDAIFNAAQVAPTFYRPTVGLRTPAVHVAAKALGLRVVTWTTAARDGIRRFTEGKALRIAKRVEAGDVLALHDGVVDSPIGGASDKDEFRQATIDHLPTVIDAIHDRGMALVTLGELLAAPL